MKQKQKLTKPIITLEGVKLRIEAPDIDGDGVTGGVESVTMDSGTQPIYQESELGESMKELNNDSLNAEGFSQIDFNSRLHVSEEPAITAWETLCGIIVPTKWLRLTTKKKRNVVSVQGLGRKEKVELVVGKREHDMKAMGGMGMGATVKNIMGLGNKGDQQ